MSVMLDKWNQRVIAAVGGLEFGSFIGFIPIWLALNPKKLATLFFWALRWLPSLSWEIGYMVFFSDSDTNDHIDMT